MFDEYAFLRMDYLIVAFLEFSVNINVLDVEGSEVLENFIGLPISNVLDTLLIDFFG